MSPQQPPHQPPGPSMAWLVSPMTQQLQKQVLTQSMAPPGCAQHSQTPVLQDMSVEGCTAHQARSTSAIPVGPLVGICLSESG
eukprot:CAMPEP_0115470220 /NCGR_PEP_ID=MMETSP0271-20121206/51888_1 /TAXON_ID=71861 /ORGANISM="Scrippsiella trochoidea, Strain CCMP3099" /LENGTH=82 /DNA_ID=CAMNT_0002897353 /DNA_START=392 /DNA_END=636 /DNA_ORIENTATION=-